MSFETLQQAFVRGRIDRRTFIKRATAMGALSAVPAGLLAQQAKADEPKRGGHLRVATVQGSTTDGLDPATLSSGFVNMLWYTAYTQLTEVNAEGELEPLLAESYEPMGGPDKWLFTLRTGVEFHNGKTVDSNDVIQSLRRAQGEKSTSAMKSFADTIVDMKADGPDKVIFALAGGNADFPFGLSASALSILPADGDTVASKWTFNATQQGAHFEHGASGQKIQVDGMSFARVRNGKFVEYYALADKLAWAKQLGIVDESVQL